MREIPQLVFSPEESGTARPEDPFVRSRHKEIAPEILHGDVLGAETVHTVDAEDGTVIHTAAGVGALHLDLSIRRAGRLRSEPQCRVSHDVVWVVAKISWSERIASPPNKMPNPMVVLAVRAMSAEATPMYSDAASRTPPSPVSQFSIK